HIVFAPPTADLRPRTGGSPPVQQHAQACCEPLTLALGPEAQGPRHAKSCRAREIRYGWRNGGGLADVRPADGGRWVVKARTMIDRSWPPWERRRPRRLTL